MVDKEVSEEKTAKRASRVIVSVYIYLRPTQRLYVTNGVGMKEVCFGILENSHDILLILKQNTNGPAVLKYHKT